MGRSGNSFTSWVGHAAETIDGDRVTLPEKDLWVAVLTRAVLDAVKGPPNLNMKSRANISHKNHWSYNQDQARHFFLEGGAYFKLICEMAGRNPSYVQQRVRKIILRKNGWNVDVPVTSHYRSGRGRKRGRPPKKKLTGNSYYAFIGKKGGRPRLYNNV
jgi:hypothetical protein